uniref:Deoxyribonuclease-1-like 1 n=1 Tax=Myripristis murdjan TaxID=586833 RepID=A0A667YNW7_9TELE
MSVYVCVSVCTHTCAILLLICCSHWGRFKKKNLTLKALKGKLKEKSGFQGLGVTCSQCTCKVNLQTLKVRMLLFCVCRTGTVTVTDQYQYPDTLKGDIDAFAREPFVVRFTLKDFVLIPLHTSPNNTTKELDAVVDVFNDIRKKWKTENVIFLGDFNADCGYLAKKNRKNVRLITDPAFIWLINDKNDTTVRKSTDCAYDRIVVHGEKVARAIVPLSAKPFNFKKEFRLSEDQALEVSDHYPVEVLLKASASRQQQVSLSLLLILLALTFNCS